MQLLIKNHYLLFNKELIRMEEIENRKILVQKVGKNMVSVIIRLGRADSIKHLSDC